MASPGLPPATSLLRRMALALGRRGLLAVVGVLLAADLLIPDPVPLVDELLLAVGFAILARRGR